MSLDTVSHGDRPVYSTKPMGLSFSTVANSVAPEPKNQSSVAATD